MSNDVAASVDDSKIHDFHHLIAQVCAVGALVLGTVMLGAAIALCSGLALPILAGISSIFVAGGAFSLKRMLFHSDKLNSLTPIDYAALDQEAAVHKADLFVTSSTDEGFFWKKELIAHAEHSIELTANFAGREPFFEFLDIVQQRMDVKSQLKVRIMVSDDYISRKERARLQDLKEHYSSQFEYLITGRKLNIWGGYSEENHAKMLIVDEKYFVGGGTGLDLHQVSEIPRDTVGFDEPLAAHLTDTAFHDNDVVGCSETLAKEMRKQFYELYNYWLQREGDDNFLDYFAITSDKSENPSFTAADYFADVDTQFIMSLPKGNHRDNPLQRKMIQLVRGAKKEIILANLLLNPTSTLAQELQAKKDIGVHITGYTGRSGKGHHFIHIPMAWASRKHYNLFDRVFEYAKKRVMYHKKNYLFDDDISVVASVNIAEKANIDSECGLVMHDRRVNAFLRERLQEDEDDCRCYTGAKLRRKQLENPLKKAFVHFAGPISM